MDDQSPSKEQIIEMLMVGFKETPYHQLIDLDFSYQEKEQDSFAVLGKFTKKESLLGNLSRNMVHGGVISGVFDALGGVTCSVALVDRYMHLGPQKGLRKLNRLCTVGLKMDFIAPAKGESFIAQGSILNMGSSIILVEMQMHDDQNKLIASASANYMY